MAATLFELGVVANPVVTGDAGVDPEDEDDTEVVTGGESASPEAELPVLLIFDAYFAVYTINTVINRASTYKTKSWVLSRV